MIEIEISTGTVLGLGVFAVGAWWIRRQENRRRAVVLWGVWSVALAGAIALMAVNRMAHTWYLNSIGVLSASSEVLERMANSVTPYPVGSICIVYAEDVEKYEGWVKCDGRKLGDERVKVMDQPFETEMQLRDGCMPNFGEFAILAGADTTSTCLLSPRIMSEKHRKVAFIMKVR